MTYINKILYLLSDRRKKIPFLLLLFLFSSFFDLIGISLVAPYVTLFLMPESLLESKFYILVSNFFEITSVNDLLIIIGLLMVVVFLLKTLFVIYINRIIIKFSFQESVNLRAFLMKAYQNLSYEKYLEKNSSQYVYNIQALAWTFSGSILQSFLRVISDSIVCIAIFLLLFIANPLALLMLLFLIIIFAVCYDFFYKKKLHMYGIQTNANLKNMIQSLNEGMHGLKEIRILGIEKFFFKKVKYHAQEFSNASIETYIINLMPRYIFEFIAVTFVVLLVSIVIFLDNDPTVLIATLSMFGIAAIRLIPSTTQIIAGITAMRFGKDSLDILYEDLKKLDDVRDGIFNDKKKDANKEEFKKLTLKNVSFTYSKMKLPAINEIDLEIKKGNSIGIIGASGAGKSTLIDIILGLLKPCHGEILLNDNKIEKNISEWRSKVAYLPQQVFLTDDTITNNIALGEDQNNINIVKVKESLKKARLTDFIANLPLGLDTKLGENGMRLSGGQRQRISLARAFYYNREFLILDEATSSIDIETEKKIVEEINFLKGKTTMIVIAHRLSTVENCDYVYEVKEGNIKKI